MNVTIREYLEQTRESMLYLRERMDDYRMAEMKARNPLKRDLDGMVLSLGDQKAELDQLEQEATAQGKRAYAMINMLDNPRQKNALWSYYAYGLTEAAAMKRGRYRSREEMRKAMSLGIQELETLVMEIQRGRKRCREENQCLN